MKVKEENSVLSAFEVGGQDFLVGLGLAAAGPEVNSSFKWNGSTQFSQADQKIIAKPAVPNQGSNLNTAVELDSCQQLELNEKRV